MLARWLQRQWFQRRLTPALWLLSPVLAPLSLLFASIAVWRRKRLPRERLTVPVVVVGNLVVGGAGKTPLTLALASAFIRRGRRPGIVSRGHGGSNVLPRPVTAAAMPDEVGDEPLLLARRAGCPVWVGRDRVAGGRALLAAHPEVDMVLCDDGLQHYRLARDVELAVFDRRGPGNARCLPWGPLREPLSRLAEVDAVIGNDGFATGTLPGLMPGFPMRLQPGAFYRLDAPQTTCIADDLSGRTLHAIAGIGDPGRFFATLSGLGLRFKEHPFPDHHAYQAGDLDFGPDAVLLMTEKDAVKCRALEIGEAWVLPVDAELPPALVDLILEKLIGRQAA